MLDDYKSRIVFVRPGEPGKPHIYVILEDGVYSYMYGIERFE